MVFLTVLRRSPVVLAMACAMVAALVFVSEGSYWRSVGALDELGGMGAARTQIQNLQRRLPRLPDLRLDPTVRVEIEASLRFLADHYRADALAAGQVARLQALVAERAGERDTAPLINALLAHQLQEVTTRREELYHTLLLGRLGVALLSGFGLFALYMMLRQASALQTQQKERQRLVQSERDRLEAEVAQRTAQLTELMQHLQTAREDERNRLARDLHDELGALLTSAKLDAARMKSRLVGGAPETLERLAHLVATLDSVIALKRRITEDLRPSALSNLGLVVTLEIAAREFSERSGIAVHCAFAPVRLGESAELVVYRLVQEAITNITKYAQARNVWLMLADHGDHVEVSVRDDGVGFDPQSHRPTAHGLMGMRYRAEAEHGSLTVVSAPGQGTLIRVSLPQAAAS
jgi:signal transduction histidine kinase